MFAVILHDVNKAQLKGTAASGIRGGYNAVIVVSFEIRLSEVPQLYGGEITGGLLETPLCKPSADEGHVCSSSRTGT